jgi:hypothetical protein
MVSVVLQMNHYVSKLVFVHMLVSFLVVILAVFELLLKALEVFVLFPSAIVDVMVMVLWDSHIAFVRYLISDETWLINHALR